MQSWPDLDQSSVAKHNTIETIRLETHISTAGALQVLEAVVVSGLSGSSKVNRIALAGAP